MLSDLDELALRCRSSRSRQHLAEAINCYRSGAYRACIVATWVAVTFDLIDKLGELSLAGDNEARATLDKFHDARGRGDVKAALDFERNLLEAARTLELISHIEEIDLQRLMEDRHRCAHPSMLLDGEVFSAPAELARLHIHNAVSHVMAQEPAQGKAALELLIREIQSEYFPRTLKETRQYLSGSVLKKPRAALLSNFIAVVMKNFLLESQKSGGDSRYLNALTVTKELHPAGWEVAFQNHLAKIVARCESSDQMQRVLHLLATFGNDSWRHLDDAQQIRIANYVESLPAGALSLLKELDIPSLQDRVATRIRKIRAQDLAGFSPWEFVPPELIPRCIGLLRGAPSSSAADTIFHFLIDHSDELTLSHVDELLAAANITLSIRKCAKRLQLYEALIAREDAEENGIRKHVMLSDDYRRVLGAE